MEDYNYENGAKGRTYHQRKREAEERTPWKLADVIMCALAVFVVLACMVALLNLNHISLGY